MKTKKKYLSLILLLAFIVGMLPMAQPREVHAIEESAAILSEPTASLAQMETWATKLEKPEFAEAATLFYNLSVERGINPVIPYAISAWKTGYFNFTGTVQADWHNPAGLSDSTQDPPFARFYSWEEGITAMLDNLALAAGQEGYPLPETPDPNHNADLHGIVTTVGDLEAVYGEGAVSHVAGTGWQGKGNLIENTVVPEEPPVEEIEGTPILRTSTTSIAQMRQFAEDNNAQALVSELAPLFIEVGLKAGVDPAIPFVHFIWQSGWGAYAGTVQAGWHNPAALRNEEGNLLQFANWTEGITAHVDHLALLAGQEGYPLAETPDPKHTAERLGTAPTVEDLGTAYGDQVWTSKTLELLEALAATVTEADPVDGTPIMGPSTTTVEDMRKWAESRNANPLFVELAQTFYDVAVEVGVDPAVIYTQSAKETNFMHFTGVLDASFMNPCGLKSSGGGGDYDPDAHHRFESWEQGIRAQADHLALYAGAEGYPDPNSPDPRHFPSIAGVAPTVEELGGRWAPSPTYGREIVVMMEQLYSVNDPDYNVGDQDGQPIMNEPTATVEQMVLWAESKNADQDFIDLAQAFYDISVSKGVDPIVTYAHAALATDFFAFERSVIDKSFYSTANIKTSVAGPDEDPNSFQRFADWEEGILAHVDHLGLYAGGEGYPDENSPDPRHFPSIKGTAPTVESLGGRWIPRADYGTEILAAMEEIWAMEVVDPRLELPLTESTPDSVDATVYANTLEDHGLIVEILPLERILEDRLVEAYEIRVYDRASGERVYETVGPLSFEITLAMDIDNQLELYHDVDGALVEVPITSIEGQVVRFEAASFSPYLFVMPAPVDETEPTATETIDPSTDESSSIPSEEASEATTPTVSTDDSDDVPATGETNYSMLVGISILGIAALLVVVAVVLKKRREE